MLWFSLFWSPMENNNRSCVVCRVYIVVWEDVVRGEWSMYSTVRRFLLFGAYNQLFRMQQHSDQCHYYSIAGHQTFRCRYKAAKVNRSRWNDVVGFYRATLKQCAAGTLIITYFSASRWLHSASTQSSLWTPSLPLTKTRTSSRQWYLFSAFTFYTPGSILPRV